MSSPNPRIDRLSFAAALAASLLAGCPRAPASSSPSPHAVADDVVAKAGKAVDPARCEDSKSRLRPFTVDWDATEQAELESLAQESVVLVKVSGCSLELLPQCRVPGAYRFIESSSHEQSLSLTSRDALYAELPLAFASLSGHLDGESSLGLRYFIRGLMSSSAPALYRPQLGAGCAGATHLIINFAVGAYELGASSSNHAGAGGRAFGVSAGAESARTAKTLFRGGDIAKCREEPGECRAPVRLRLVPIVEAPPTGDLAPAAARAATKPDASANVQDHISRGDILGAMRVAQPALRACWEGQSGGAPMRLIARFVVAPEGTVQSLALESSESSDQSFLDCAQDALNSARFPAARQKLSFAYPFVFSP